MAPRSLFKNYADGPRQRRVPDAHVVEQTTLEYLVEMSMDSLFLKENPPRSVAMFASSELVFGNPIGMGEFGQVLEIDGVRLSQDKKLCDCECPLPPASGLITSSAQRVSIPRVSKSCVDLSLLSELEVSEGSYLFGCSCKEEPCVRCRGEGG